MNSFSQNCRKAAVCFTALLFTFFGATAQNSHESSDAERPKRTRPTSENVNTPAQQPRVSFSESVKQKTAEQQPAAVAAPQAQPVKKTTTATTAALKQQPNIKLTEAQVAAAKAKREAANAQHAAKKLEAPHEKFPKSQEANGNSSLSLGGKTLKPNLQQAKDTEVAKPTPYQSYVGEKQQANLWVAPQPLSEKEIAAAQKLEQEKANAKEKALMDAFNQLPLSERIQSHKNKITELEGVLNSGSRGNQSADSKVALRNAYQTFLAMLEAEQKNGVDLTVEIQNIKNRLATL